MSVLTDDDARHRIATDTVSTLFVNAGAGSGKTRGLVDRVRQLVLVDQIPLRQIAAVTFTEKAGAELRSRLRAEFDSVWRSAIGGTPEHTRAEEALNDLDMSAIGTLHSFAQRILAAYPIEAGLPPLVEVLDEVGSSVAFDSRWTQLQRDLLDDQSMTAVVLQALGAGVKLEQLRSLARAFGYDWDLIDTHVLASEPKPAVMPDLMEIRARARGIANAASICRDDSDRFLPKLARVEVLRQALSAASDDQHRFEALSLLNDVRWGVGAPSKWPTGILKDLQSDCRALQEDVAQVLADYVDATLRPVAYWIAQRVRAAAYERAGEGKVEFHDLLVLGRNLLRTSADARAGLQWQYRRILLDEFQDTDPIQVELAVRIAGGREATADDWRDIDVPAGTLFFVGDPKQSIYRFRRANIRSYLQVSGWHNEPVTLSTNFRTVEPIIDWVNTVFSEVIREEEGRQPSYDALAAYRTEVGVGPAVVLLGSAPNQDKPNASTLRELEATDVAATILRALDEQWTTEQTEDKDGHQRSTWRAIKLRDIAVLLPARTSLPYLETALEEAGIAYRAESSSLVYEAPEVRALMSALRAVVDPADQLACATALRSPLFGCSDLDLWQFKRAKGSFNLLAPSDPSRDNLPVGQAMNYLRDLHYRSRWMTPSEVLDALIADRRMLEFAATAHRRRDIWRRLRFVVDHARAWSETQHGGLRAYVAWATRQADEASRVAEAVLPEIDVDAVRVMTIHAAKGLEFPMVVLSGMTSGANNRTGVAVRWNEHERGYAVRMSKRVQTNDFEAAQALDEQMDELEKRRLLYVATTRARDHLVVSLHHKPLGPNAKTRTNAQLLVEAAGGTSVERFSAAGAESRERVVELADPPPDLLEWRARIERAQLRTRHESAQSASGLEGTEPAARYDEVETSLEGLAKGARDTDLPPWSKGRYGTAIGRAVHAVLQSVDLSTGSDLDRHVQTQCVAEGVTAYTELVRGLAQSALDSPIVKHAAARRHWRESYAGKTLPDGTLLEGIIDLIYEDDDGTLIIVDYKTDDIPEAALPARQAFYGPQLAAYEDLIGAAVPTATVRSVLLFTTANAAQPTSEPDRPQSTLL